MPFRIYIYDYKRKLIKSLPEKEWQAYQTRFRAEAEAEKAVVELQKTKKWAGRLLRAEVRWSSALKPDILY